ncbi:MAG TPA: DUF1801 domain-containing protein [Verrucomicrobiae bacterium]|nr:DUF1801 domain-containing protein [Verrucomicrobiae bacterium]
MKRAKPGERRSGAKRKSAPATVEEYLSTISEPARSALVKMRAAIRSAAPSEAVETISYRMPALRTKNGVLVWFAAFSSHCSLFPTAAVIEAFKDELRNFSTSKGTIHFATGKPLPIALIKKIVKARVQHIEKKKQR